jgi:hypothetical protein
LTLALVLAVLRLSACPLRVTAALVALVVVVVAVVVAVVDVVTFAAAAVDVVDVGAVGVVDVVRGAGLVNAYFLRLADLASTPVAAAAEYVGDVAAVVVVAAAAVVAAVVVAVAAVAAADCSVGAVAFLAGGKPDADETKLVDGFAE